MECMGSTVWALRSCYVPRQVYDYSDFHRIVITAHEQVFGSRTVAIHAVFKSAQWTSVPSHFDVKTSGSRGRV